MERFGEAQAITVKTTDWVGDQIDVAKRLLLTNLQKLNYNRLLGERQSENYLSRFRWESEAPAELGFGLAGASPSRYRQSCRSP